MKLTKLPPLRRKGDPVLLVYAIYFPDDELKAHPYYNPNNEDDNKEYPPSPVDSDDSSDEDEGDSLPRFRVNRFMGSLIMILEDFAKHVYEKSRLGLVIVPNSGGDTGHSIILANNSNSDEREIPPPETIARLKEALKTTRDPEWYRVAGRLKPE